MASVSESEEAGGTLRKKQQTSRALSLLSSPWLHLDSDRPTRDVGRGEDLLLDVLGGEWELVRKRSEEKKERKRKKKSPSRT